MGSLEKNLWYGINIGNKWYLIIRGIIYFDEKSV